MASVVLVVVTVVVVCLLAYLLAPYIMVRNHYGGLAKKPVVKLMRVGENMREKVYVGVKLKLQRAITVAKLILQAFIVFDARRGCSSFCCLLLLPCFLLFDKFWVIHSSGADSIFLRISRGIPTTKSGERFIARYALTNDGSFSVRVSSITCKRV